MVFLRGRIYDLCAERGQPSLMLWVIYVSKHKTIKNSLKNNVSLCVGRLKGKAVIQLPSIPEKGIQLIYNPGFLYL